MPIRRDDEDTIDRRGSRKIRSTSLSPDDSDGNGYARVAAKPSGRSSTESGTNSIPGRAGGRKVAHRADSRRDLGKKLG